MSEGNKQPRKVYVGYMFRAGSRKRYGAAGLEVQASVTWTLTDPATRAVREYMATWDERGYKIGLLVAHGQRIDRLAYARQGGGEIDLQLDATLIPDLARTFGTPAGSEWVGFVSTKERREYVLIEPNVVEFQVTLRITPGQRGPQLVPIASRHLDGTFEQAYMPGLWVLPRLPD